MCIDEDKHAVVKFLFDSEQSNLENIDVALCVLSARKQIIYKIINDFVDEFSEYLNQEIRKLGGTWEVVNELQAKSFERYSQIYITKKEWKGFFRVALGPEKNEAREFILGVVREDQYGHQVDDCGGIKASLQGHVKSGYSSKWWPYYIYADPFRNWDDVKTLSCFLKERRSQPIINLSNVLLTIARESERVIDSLIIDFSKQSNKNF